MKRLFTIFIAIILIGNFSFAQERAVNTDGNYENVIRVKVNDDLAKKFEALHSKSANINKISATSTGAVKTNVQALDVKNEAFKATEYKRVFRYAGKFEEKHREFGLHRWYEISFNSKSSVNELIRAYKEIGDLEYVLPVSKKSLTNHPERPAKSAKSLSEAPNDPRFNDQWHYENTGQNSGTPGCDISLLDAWTIETGNSQVIVAIEDGGVDVDHPDLVGNMWINTNEIAGNGIDDDNNGYVDDVHGYNFGDSQGTINQNDHATHVAGTVAAETNNGIGVSGIAGGTGNNDGVRIMSCQVFGSSSQGGFAEAFVYAADMGAHISQNSWGGGGEDASINDAIDYFIANGGSAGSPMQGGVVIVAAGNSNTSSGASIWPAAYVNAIAVAATNKNDAKANYSNYGTWVDISAPGGELESTNNDPTAIHSTYGNGGYGVMQGTSMACPHVSGVAALIVSKFAGNITPAEVRARLIDYADDIDDHIPSYIGQMGSGRLNAYAALTGTPPQPPAATYCTSQGNDFSYEWIAKVEVGTFVKSSTGAAYSDFTNEVIDVNAGQSYNITLTPGFSNTSYDEYWKIWIDYNNDTTFSEEELVYDAGTASSSAVSGSITIESGISGIRRMRVSMKYNEEQTACETFSYGEVEDYNINISSSTADTEAPTAPTNLAASSVTQTTLSLGWTASTDNVGVTGYDIYRNGSLLASTTSTSYSVTGLTASTTYTFYVKAKDAAGNVSAASSTISVTTSSPTADTQAPTVPTNLASSSITESSVVLSWTASTDNVGVTGYDIYRNGSLLASTTSTSYSVTGLTASTTYTFYVKAKDAAGNVSAASSTISVTTSSPTADTQAPTVPTNLASSSITESSVVLSWTASTDNVGVTGYDIYRNGSLLASTTSTSYSVTGLTASTTYTFYVKAKDAAGNVSSASTTLSVTTDEEVVEEYCSSSGSSAYYFWINQVVLNEINNISGFNNGYGNFTNQIASITPGNTEILYIQSGYSGYIYTVYWSIWIDFNANGAFETSERILTGSTAQTGFDYGYFTVPTNAVLGNTRMRISMKYGGLATSCENFAYGEVEDYTVNITNSPYTINSLISGGKQLDFVDENEVRIFPNPVKDKLNIELNTAVASDIQIISTTGAVVKTIIADEHVIGIDVSDLTTGMYFIQYNNGLENKTFKFIKE